MNPPPAWLSLLADLREGRGLDAIASSWGDGDDGAARWYAESLRAYLGGTSSRASAAAFCSTLAFFFAWASEARAKREGTRARLLSPGEVLESDVKAWAEWLREGGSWVVPAFAGGQLAQVLVQLVENHGQGDGLDWQRLHALASPVAQVPRDAGVFIALLGDLARRHLIDRRPRRADVRVKDDSGQMRPLRSGETPPPEVFRYVAVKARGEASPATVATRLACVAGFYRELLRPKNLPGVACPVAVNPASYHLERASRAKLSEERARGLARKSTMADLQLLRALIEHAPGRSDVLRARDSLLVSLLFTMGLRLSEALGARLGDITTAPGPDGSTRPALRVHRKGGKAQVLPLSDAVRDGLSAYQEALRESARDKSYVDVALSPGAPLVQGAGAWGEASDRVAARVERARSGKAKGARASREVHPALVPMSPKGASAMFHRYVDTAVEAVATGPARKAAHDQLSARLHAHGLRHLFAQVAIESGMGLREVAAHMGHDGIGTLERTYAPQVDVMRFDYGPMLEAALGQSVPMAGPPAPRAPRPRPSREREVPPQAAPRPAPLPAPEEAPAPRSSLASREGPHEGPRLVEAQPHEVRGDEVPEADLAGPPTIFAVGAQGRSAYFVPAPSWAYETRPLLLTDAQARAMIAAGNVPENAVSAHGLPQGVRDDGRIFSGLVSLLPYRVIEGEGGAAGVGRGGAFQANRPRSARLFVPVPCLERDAGNVGYLVRLGEATVDPARGDARSALVRWWAYLLSAGRWLDWHRRGPMKWLPWEGEEPAWNGPGETQTQWRARMHASHLRAHDVEAGIGGFLRAHGATWPAAFDPPQMHAFDPDGQGRMVANPAPSPSVSALAELSLTPAEGHAIGQLLATPSGPVARELVRLFVG